jgi:hypothetical protein
VVKKGKPVRFHVSENEDDSLVAYIVPCSLVTADQCFRVRIGYISDYQPDDGGSTHL